MVNKNGLILLKKAAPSLNPWDLMGSYNKGVRKEIMSALVGKPMPIAKSGVTAINKVLLDAFNPEGNCDAVRRDNLVKMIAEVLESEAR